MCQGELAHRTHHHEHRRAADDVGQQYGGTGQLNRGGGTVEQTRADGRAKGDEHNVAQGEAARELSTRGPLGVTDASGVGLVCAIFLTSWGLPACGGYVLRVTCGAGRRRGIHPPSSDGALRRRCCLRASPRASPPRPEAGRNAKRRQEGNVAFPPSFRQRLLLSLTSNDDRAQSGCKSSHSVRLRATRQASWRSG